MSNITRKQHVEWAKARALEYVDRGELTQSLASIVSDLQKHPETRNHPGLIFLPTNPDSNPRRYQRRVRHFIEGFN